MGMKQGVARKVVPLSQHETPHILTERPQRAKTEHPFFIIHHVINTVIVMDALSSGFIICLMRISESPSTVCSSSQNKHHVTAFSNWLHWLSILGAGCRFGSHVFKMSGGSQKRYIFVSCYRKHTWEMQTLNSSAFFLFLSSAHSENISSRQHVPRIFLKVFPSTPYTLHFAYSPSCKDIFEIFL